LLVIGIRSHSAVPFTADSIASALPPAPTIVCVTWSSLSLVRPATKT
jgi:hypothetical protein